ncbi:T9SS type A sorting domain-containing protein [Dyadobacter sp. CY261]|uniref:T9SS type A sorting domain-containing protein n=1 Tax=Dyadobacter sp. CY261 TaxID=2907203 RepID=UPI001F2144EE|nr:T9SS type A sorting domain-containing protein [Dyadobacter sp. CY261]MCF0074049.1 T9SS type A sorting domain-containing protein [Dyadobacter sp. CY261]
MKKSLTFLSLFLLAGCLCHAQGKLTEFEYIPDKVVLTKLSSRSQLVKARKIMNVNVQMQSGSLVAVAGQAIILEPGFSVTNGAQFHGKIEEVNSDQRDIVLEEAGPVKMEVEFDQNKLSINNYPNPFIKSTEVQYWLPEDSKVSLLVYDDSGILISRVFQDSYQARGLHKVSLEGQHLTSGTYSCVLSTPSQRKVRKIVKL